MLKVLITPKENTYLLPIPTNYIGKTVEVLLYSGDEVFEDKSSTNKKPSEFFGTLSTTEGEKFQAYVTNSRLEWNRNI
jgi:hypothetical protein